MITGGCIRNAGFGGEKPNVVIDNQWNIPWRGWLVYRWISVIYFIIWLILAIMEFSGPKIKFLIFLTSWAFILLTGSTIHRAVLLTVSLYNNGGKSNTRKVKYKSIPNMMTEWLLPIQNELPDHVDRSSLRVQYRFPRPKYYQSSQLQVLNWNYKIAWMGDNVSSVFAVCVAFGFWAVINRDGSMPVTAVTIHTHGINALYVLIDLFLSAKTIRVLQIWHSVLIAIIYMLFGIIYWLAGGTGMHGEPYIYASMDWNKPARTVPLSLAFTLVLPAFVQLFLYGVYRLRLKIYQLTAIKNRVYETQPDNETTETMLPP